MLSCELFVLLIVIVGVMFDDVIICVCVCYCCSCWCSFSFVDVVVVIVVVLVMDVGQRSCCVYHCSCCCGCCCCFLILLRLLLLLLLQCVTLDLGVVVLVDVAAQYLCFQRSYMVCPPSQSRPHENTSSERNYNVYTTV